MKITILDTKTNKKKTIQTDFPPYWWAEGNGSCDCNRAIKMDCEDEMDAQMRKKHPELKEWQCLCFGCERFLITECDDKEYTLREFNSDYPKRLIEKHLISLDTEEKP